MRTGFQHLDADIPEFHGSARRIRLQADMSERRPLGQRTLLGNVISGVVQIHIENLLSVPYRSHCPLDNGDLHLVPFPVRFGHVSRWRHCPVERTSGVHIGRLAGIAQDLQFHAGKGWVAGWRGPQKDTAIALRARAIFQAQDEIVIGVVGGEPAPAFYPGDDALAPAPRSGVRLKLDGMPARERLAVVEQLESLLALLMAEAVLTQCDGNESEKDDDSTHNKLVSVQLSAISL